MEEQEKRIGLGKSAIRESVNEQVKRLAKAAGKTKEQWVEWAIEKMVERVKDLKVRVEEIDKEEQLTLKSVLPEEGCIGTEGPGPHPAGISQEDLDDPLTWETREGIVYDRLGNKRGHQDPPGEPGEPGARFAFHLRTGDSLYSDAETLEAALEELGLQKGDYLNYHDSHLLTRL